MAEELALDILSGNVKPGEKLATEQVLCSRYDVSRTIAREALQALAAKGLILSRPRVGAVVCMVESWQFLDADIIRWTEALGENCQYYDAILEARVFLEPQFASIAALRAKREDIIRIETALIAMETAAKACQLEDFHEADLAFHLAILHATHNIVLRRLGDLLRAAMGTSFRKAVAHEPISKRSVALHRTLFEAIRDGDPIVARESLRNIASILEERLNMHHSA